MLSSATPVAVVRRNSSRIHSYRRLIVINAIIRKITAQRGLMYLSHDRFARLSPRWGAGPSSRHPYCLHEAPPGLHRQPRPDHFGASHNGGKAGQNAN